MPLPSRTELTRRRRHSYYASLIRDTHITVASLLANAVSSLTTEQQTELVKELSKVLALKGVKHIGL